MRVFCHPILRAPCIVQTQVQHPWASAAWFFLSSPSRWCPLKHSCLPVFSLDVLSYLSMDGSIQGQAWVHLSPKSVLVLLITCRFGVYFELILLYSMKWSPTLCFFFLKQTLHFWSSCLHLPSSGITGMCHQAWYMRGWSSNPEPCECKASTRHIPRPSFSFLKDGGQAL